MNTPVSLPPFPPPSLSSLNDGSSAVGIQTLPVSCSPMENEAERVTDAALVERVF